MGRWMRGQKRQRGFGVTGAIALAVIVGVVGFTGWFVYNSSQKTDDVLGQTVGPDTKTPATPVSDSAKPPAPAGDTAILTVRYSEAPKALQAAILAETSASASGCVKNGAIVGTDGQATNQEVKYTASGYAQTTVGCDGGAATLFVKSGTNWKKVASTQFQYKCADLKASKVPAAFLKAVSPDPMQTVECISDDPGATAPEAYTL